MAMSLEELETLVQIDNILINSTHLVKKIKKINPVDAEISLVNLKKEEITEGKKMPGRQVCRAG